MGGIPRLVAQLRERRATRVTRAVAAALCAVALALGCTALTGEPATHTIAGRDRALVPKLVQISDGRPAMGTILEITVVASDEARARAVIELCFAETERLEMILTTWREDGELARLNARAGHGPQKASPELLRILRDAQRLSEETERTFDVTVGNLVELWREAERRNSKPAPNEVLAAWQGVGADRIRIDESGRTIELESGMSIDVGGFAKGWTLDRIGELLGRESIDRAFMSFGGSSLLAVGAPLDAPAWRVAVESDFVLDLRDRSVSISSSFGQRFEIEGVEYAHIVDPRTGFPVKRAQRAIVVANDGATAEAWSKAFVVFAPEDALRALGQNAALDVRIDSGEIRLRSPGFAQYVASEVRL